jgi:NAD(P)H-hydrate repair Nnr-like enzyme with NAD(P)H-hydrate dehydratase domain
VPIKSYSPDLMVSPIYDRSTVELYNQASTEDERSLIAQEAAQPVVDQLPKIHSLVIGPGMGRSAFLGAMMEVIIRHARSKKIP